MCLGERRVDLACNGAEFDKVPCENAVVSEEFLAVVYIVDRKLKYNMPL